MPSYFWISVAVTLLIVLADGRTTQEFPIAPGGITVDVFLRHEAVKRDAKYIPITTMKIELEGGGKITFINQEEEDEKRKGEIRNEELKPKIDNRFGIAVRGCPWGYVSRGGFCFPDYD